MLGGTQVETAGPASLRDVLGAVFAIEPSLRQRLLDDAGEQRRYVNIYVDGTDARTAGGLSMQVPDGAQVFVVGSIAGG